MSMINCNMNLLANLTSDLQNVTGTLKATLREVFVRGSLVRVWGSVYRPAQHLLASLGAERLSCWAWLAMAKPLAAMPAISPASVGKCHDRRHAGLAGRHRSERFSRS